MGNTNCIGRAACITAAALISFVHCLAVAQSAAGDAAILSAELTSRGWVVYSARTDRGDWDLFLMRPNGSARRNLTRTATYNEGGARFSPDGRHILYYRMPVDTNVDNNKYGLYDLVLALSDGAETVIWGDYPWACWSPTGGELACLRAGGISLVDVRTRQEIRRLPRHGIVQQLGWSPDGRWLTGTANGLGVAWCVGVLNTETLQMCAVAETDRFNCTPDWYPDSESVIYSRGIIPGANGWAQLWQGFVDGRPPRLLVAEEGRHLYGGCISPDGAYILFTRSGKDLGEVDIAGTTMAICRAKDTPLLIGPGDCAGMRARYPEARSGPVLHLPNGWEPDWTYAEIE